MLEERTIEVWAYNLETVLAEKVETIISRDVTNTRMRDFYDIYVLLKLYGDSLNREVLHDALIATSKKRGSTERVQEAEKVFEDVLESTVMQNLWESYQKKFTYASDIQWEKVIGTVRTIYQMMK